MASQSYAGLESLEVRLIEYTIVMDLAGQEIVYILEWECMRLYLLPMAGITRGFPRISPVVLPFAW